MEALGGGFRGRARFIASMVRFILESECDPLGQKIKTTAHASGGPVNATGASIDLKDPYPFASEQSLLGHFGFNGINFAGTVGGSFSRVELGEANSGPLDFSVLFFGTFSLGRLQEILG